MIRDYFPQIVSADLFARAHAARAERRTGFAGRKGKRISNLFSGLCRCEHCNGMMTYRNKGNGEEYLVCDNAQRSNGCSSRQGFNYTQFEDCVLRSLMDAAMHDIHFRPSNDALTLQKAIAENENDIAAKEAGIDRLTDYLFDGVHIERTRKRLLEEEPKLEALKASLNVLRKRLAEAQGKLPARERMRIVREFYKDLTAGDDTTRYERRSQLKQALHGLVDYIAFNGETMNADVVIVGAVAGFRVHKGQVVNHFDLTPAVEAGFVPMEALHLNDPDRKAKVEKLFRSV